MLRWRASHRLRVRHKILEDNISSWSANVHVKYLIYKYSRELKAVLCMLPLMYAAVSS